MKRLMLLSVLLSAGCCGITGPFEHRPTTRVDDPCVSIAQQERTSRERLALPEWDPTVVPGGVSVLPGPYGR